MNGCKGRNGLMKQGQIAAAVLATLFMFVQAQAVHALVVPGGIYSGKDVRLDFGGPTSVDRGIATQGYSSTLTNFDAFDVEENVRLTFEVLGNDDVAEGDVSIEFETAPGSGNFKAMPLTTCFSNLCGELGLEGGFPVEAGYDVTTTFRITYNQAGDYTVRASAVGVDSNNYFASAEINTNVKAPIVSVNGSGPAVVDRGVQASGFAALVENTGTGAVTEDIYLGIEISGPTALKVGQVTSIMETSPGSGEYVDVPFVVCGLNLCGDFGAAGGFAVAAGYAAANAILSTFSSTGAYVINARLVGAGSGTEYATDQWPVEVVSSASQVVITAGQSQSAPVGYDVATIPQVRVEDAGGAPLKGVAVAFSVIIGGGSVDFESVVTDSDGLASPGGWTLGKTPGTNELLVQVPGSDVDSAVFTANALPESKISVEISSNASHVTYGDTQEHVIIVSNHGASPANSVDLAVPMPQAYADGSIRWTCYSVNEAKCPAEGNGSIGTLLDLPAGASAIFVVSATVTGGDGDSEIVTLHAKVSHPDDYTPGNNFASVDTPLVLSRAGFEAGDPGAGNEGGTVQALGTLDAQNFLGLDLVDPAQGPMRTIAQGYSDRGARFTIDDIHAGDKRVLLLSASNKGSPTNWTAAIVPAGTQRIAIGLAQPGHSLPATRLLAIGEGVALDVALDADKSAEVSAATF